jgi:thioredoxin-related protein
MKKNIKSALKLGLFPLVVALAGFFSFTAFTSSTSADVKEAGAKVKWYTWEEAIKANEKEPKKLMIDLYTDWCGWCKRMDKTTFSDPKVAQYLNENFYPIKFNAEQKETIVYQGHEFKFVNQGRRGVHTLAYSLLDGKLSYPSIVFMDEEVKRIMISKGYKGADDFMKELKFTAEEEYKKK